MYANKLIVRLGTHDMTLIDTCRWYDTLAHYFKYSAIYISHLGTAKAPARQSALNRLTYRIPERIPVADSLDMYLLVGYANILSTIKKHNLFAYII